MLNVTFNIINHSVKNNIIDCICSEDAISKAITQALSDTFKQSIVNLKSPYGDGNTSARIVETLKLIDFSNKSRFLKKGFYDLKNNLSQINLQVL